MGSVKKTKRKNTWRVAAIIAAIVLIALVSSFIFYFFFRAKPAAERAMEGASTAAQVYYNFLINGDYRQFLDGRAGAAQLPDDYREQLLTAYRQFMVQQQADHGGIVAAEYSRAAIDSTLGVVQVFFLLNYADSTHEEIVVPMVEQEGVWKMK